MKTLTKLILLVLVVLLGCNNNVNHKPPESPSKNFTIINEAHINGSYYVVFDVIVENRKYTILSKSNAMVVLKIEDHREVK